MRDAEISIHGEVNFEAAKRRLQEKSREMSELVARLSNGQTIGIYVRFQLEGVL